MGIENSSFKELRDGDRHRNLKEKRRSELQTLLSKSEQIEIVIGIYRKRRGGNLKLLFERVDRWRSS
jgi:hypothetical protein